MSYIVQRQDRFYVVAYDGLDPLTGRERHRWHPVGRHRDDAEAVAQRLEREHHGSPPSIGGATTLATFLCQTWLPRKRRQVRATTAYRYAWFVERYVSPVIGDVPLRRLRADHLEDLYHQLATTGGRRGDGLAPQDHPRNAHDHPRRTRPRRAARAHRPQRRRQHAAPAPASRSHHREGMDRS